MLIQISIYEKKQKTRIEELSCKHIIGNSGQLFWKCVQTYPFNEIDDYLFQDKINSNDEEGNTWTNNGRPQLYSVIVLAHCTSVLLSIGHCHIKCVILFQCIFWVLTETFHYTVVRPLFTRFRNILVHFKLHEWIMFP